MDSALFKQLLEQRLISNKEFELVEQQQHAPVSVFWDVTTFLYLGILLFSAGLSIVVYKNIDTIGHAVIIAAIGLLCISCFIYCFKNSGRFSFSKVAVKPVLFDYVLLLGCLLMLTFVGYLQFIYNVFDSDWGFATFVPMVILFFAAYYFDHLGVLSMAITNLAAWAGFTVAPLKILRENDFTNNQLIITGVLLGAGLIAISFVSTYRDIKAHFAFTYKNFGIHILFISLLAAMFHFTAVYLLWFLALSIIAVLACKYSIRENSFYFLIVTILYAYMAVSYVVIDLMDRSGWNEGTFYLAFIYFIMSGIGLIILFTHYNKMLKKDARL